MITDPEPVLDDDSLYFCDDGAIYCGAHCRASGRYEPVKPMDVYRAKLDHWTIRCEQCGKEAQWIL